MAGSNPSSNIQLISREEGEALMARLQAEQAAAEDHVYDWIADLSEMKNAIPPFCVELAMMDGSGFYLHSIPEKDELTQSIVLRIWDLRNFSENEILQMKQNIQSCSRKDLDNPHKIHPKLDWADLHAHMQDIRYVVEWNGNIWPREERPHYGLLPA